MKNVFTHIYNKCKQFTNRIYYTCTNNQLLLHYASLINAISNLERFVNTKVRNEEPFITLISSNTLFKSIVFMYSFFSGTKLLMISPKFTISEITNTLLSKRNVNILLIDKEILSAIEKVEVEEGIDILQFFSCVETTAKMLEVLLQLKEPSQDLSLTKVSRKGRVRHLLSESIQPSVSILSPGTMSESYITNVPYKLLGKSILALSHFMGLKPSDKVSVIADFEFYPGLYTILGLLTGIHFIVPETDKDVNSGEELTEIFNRSNHKPTVLFISSYNFKKIWDSIILKVYSKKFIFMLSKYRLTSWIVNCIIRQEIVRIFGKDMRKVHILNEELGFYPLDVLKKSKIMFTSSYGFLEEGNFLAFKDPEVFKHKDFIYKPGGTLLKDSEVLFNKVAINMEKGFVSASNLSVGEICLVEDENNFLSQTILSGDVGMFIPNVPNQGDRKFLYVYGRSNRHKEDGQFVQEEPSMDLIEKSIKDTWLIRDCFLQRHWVSRHECGYKLFFEIREDLLDSKQISWQKVENTIAALVVEFCKNSSIKITHYAIIRFNGIRNIAGKLQYYNM